MSTEEKEISYTTSNTYSTLNSLHPKTKNVWLVFHGIGYLSRYFIRLFENLDKNENYIIAPQAPSKYYKGEDYRRVGSCWLTKENTTLETTNILNYIDTVITTEALPAHTRLIVLGYSQGISIAARWVASRKISCDALVLISGGFPKELTKENLAFLSETTKITHILGEKDPYFKAEDVRNEKIRLQQILPNIEFRTHPGGHELDQKTLTNLF